MTRRERLERRAERRREWAESRDRKSAAAFESARKLTDGIPLGQPILVGHHSEKPEREILAALRAAGFSWGMGSWIGKASALPAELAEGGAS